MGPASLQIAVRVQFEGFVGRWPICLASQGMRVWVPYTHLQFLDFFGQTISHRGLGVFLGPSTSEVQGIPAIWIKSGGLSLGSKPATAGRKSVNFSWQLVGVPLAHFERSALGSPNPKEQAELRSSRFSVSRRGGVPYESLTKLAAVV